MDIPDDGSTEIEVLLPDVIRVTRYEDVEPDVATSEFKYDSGVTTNYTITRE